MRRLAATIVTAGALMLGTAGSASAQPIEIGHIPKCTEAVPAAVSLPGATLDLNARVLLDGVSSTRGQQVFDAARQSYTPLGINLVPSFQNVNFTGDSAEGIIDQSKELFNGVRPAGTHVVYTLTSKDVDGNTAGLADCIGGVAFPDRAFAMGENFSGEDDNFTLPGLPIPVNQQFTAKVAAHEIGHLLGGHHHYANCVEGLLGEFAQDLSACTLMINAVDLASFNYSTLNSLVVKGHAEAYALP